ncbi:MAG: hypothetical protein IID44_29410 [Planctomycetes bacterium]|nr:hypothetical protein [Planctomycetota bacterium]
MNPRSIDRRTVLKGLGTATIGLPLLEEMLVSTGSAIVASCVVNQRWGAM